VTARSSISPVDNSPVPQGDADLLNEQVGKIGKNRHWGRASHSGNSSEEKVMFSYYITFGISEPVEEPYIDHQL
jgi:hypothetical protein